MSSPLTCNHGFFLADCAICGKRKGECDYGSCTEPATTSVDTVRNGRFVESRPTCARHSGTRSCFGCAAVVPDEPGLYYCDDCDDCVAAQTAAAGDELAAFDAYHRFADSVARRTA